MLPGGILCSNEKKVILKSITAQTIVSDSRRLQKLTQRGNKMFMGTQGFHATLVFVVPDPQSLVISTAHNELSTRVEEQPTHPVIMANLRKTSEYHTQHKSKSFVLCCSKQAVISATDWKLCVKNAWYLSIKTDQNQVRALGMRCTLLN